MITAVDTNVLLDVFSGDATHGRASAQALREARSAGALIACEVVWAEVAAFYGEPALVAEPMAKVDLEFSAVDRASALEAGAAWRRYRRAGGPRRRILPDFLIAAHASVHADRLLTRDRGFYRSHFSRLEVLDPAA